MAPRGRVLTPIWPRCSAISAACCFDQREKDNMALVEIKVPDIGDFESVSVIELLVKVGDTIKPEQSLITVESDKASMEIPASQGGVVKELKVKLGDAVKQGSVVLLVEAAGAAAPATAPAAGPKTTAPTPAAASFGGSTDLDCDVLVLGG